MTDGQAKSKKIMYFQHFSKTTRYFFLVLSLPLRRLFQTFSEKNQKISNNFFFSAIFSIFLSKKVYFSNITRYFFLVVSLPLRRLFKTFSEKNSKKIKIFKFVKKFRTSFFFSDFFDFLSKKVYFSKTIRYFFLVVSKPLRRLFKTFSEKNSKKIEIF